MKAKLTLIFSFLIYIHIANAQLWEIGGQVVDKSTTRPIEGVTVRSSNRGINTVTDTKGLFSIACKVGDSLTFTAVGYEKTVITVVAERTTVLIELLPIVSELNEVSIVSTGYQRLPKERATGSFDVIDNKLLNRSVSTDMLSRLENLSPGLLFNRGDAADTDPFLIRGRSTITADAQPLIVVDDFPYDGDLNNINPNDIEQVSILKDAAAASIWGARAANGVIVITTKKGKRGGPRLEVNSNLTYQGRPDLSNVSIISSEDRVEWERFLFESEHYADAQSANTLVGRVSAIPETAELLIADPEDLELRLDELKSRNVMSDIDKYFYQESIKQQYGLGISGAGEKIDYAFRGGFDHNQNNLVGEGYDRISLRSTATYRMLDKLSLNMTMAYTQSDDRRGRNNGMYTDFGNGLSPYAKLADELGIAMPYFGYYREGFLDTVGVASLLDWNFRPIEEISLQQTSDKLRDYVVNTGLNYVPFPGLSVDFKYQYQNQLTNGTVVYDENSFEARNRINMFAQYDRLTENVEYPVPLGGMRQATDREVNSHQGRAQISYNARFASRHEVDAIAGYEIRSRITTGSSHFNYGYRERYSDINVDVDYLTRYPVNTSSGLLQVPRGTNGISKQTDNFLSYYSNVAYMLDGRYTLSASFRKDEANLFGVSSNMKGTPLWSLGAAWNLSDEHFFNIDWLPYLRVRATYGTNGNVSRAASAATRAVFSSGGQTHRYSRASIQQPPNEHLRWEKVKMLNLGLEFHTKNNRLSGSAEYYDKHALDLLAETPTDPTLGFSSVFANVANMRGKGWDVQLNTRNINGRFKWQSHLIYSFSANKVTGYLMPISSTGRTYATSLISITPVIGRPVYSVYSFQWAGLDPQTGAPRGLLDGEVSMDYNAIYNTTTLDEMDYHGPTQPTHFGAFRNTFSYWRFDASVNISYKAGSFFRTPSIINYELVNGWSGHGNYALRWKQAGDELRTHVPAMVYPAVNNRDNVYRYSSILIHKADYVRIEDINISYGISRVPKMPFESLRVFFYWTNLGTLWVANKDKIDPYYNNVPSPAASVSLGLNVTF